VQGAAGAGLTIVGAALAAIALNAPEGGNARPSGERAAIGEARAGALTVALPQAVSGVAITEARAPGRPIVLIDPGHGGRDPGAPAVSGATSEKMLTLAMARELRDLLAKRGRVRVALTRDDDRYLTLDQRAALAGRIGASLYVSLHMDSAPNPLARGATVYSLSDVASDADAARLAGRENAAGSAGVANDGSVEAILDDLALREQMTASAELAIRLVRKAQGRVLLRPEPHRFALFHVLKQAEVPAVLFEAGYVSNADDEVGLTTPQGRANTVAALADAIEADVAVRR
jgi:N-acetylmuramoyl-L-alanine amidase